MYIRKKYYYLLTICIISGLILAYFFCQPKKENVNINEKTITSTLIRIKTVSGYTTLTLSDREIKTMPIDENMYSSCVGKKVKITIDSIPNYPYPVVKKITLI